MVSMVARLRVVLSCLVVACSCEGNGLRTLTAHDAGGFGGSGGSQAISLPDARAVTGDSSSSVGTGGEPSGVGGEGGTDGQLATATSTATPICVPGSSVACECTAGLQGIQTCGSGGWFPLCVCSPPADAGGAGGSDGAAASPPDAPSATGGTDSRTATGGVGGGDAPLAAGGTGAGATAGATGTAGGATSSAGATDTATLRGVSTATGSMTTARWFHTATLLSSGKVLIAGGQDASRNFLASAELYDPVTGTFTATGSMTAARSGHTATFLFSGKVLIAGGEVGDSGMGGRPSAELYDPTFGTFTTVGAATAARPEHTATLLPNGKVLIAGGVGWYGGDEVGTLFSFASAQLFDPSSGQFAATGSMTATRCGHGAVLLPNGKVLIVGGGQLSDISNGLVALASAELYDPTAGTFAATGSMATARYDHSATLLSGGKVLVAGGSESGNTPAFSSAELYDPNVGKFTATGSMTTAREFHTATVLPGWGVLVAGGFDGTNAFASAEMYDPTAGTFAATGSMTTTRYGHTATLLSSGKVLIAGGSSGVAPLASAELYEYP
jgi:Galactose oxidase, central domain